MSPLCSLQNLNAFSCTIAISTFLVLFFFLFINRKWKKSHKRNLPPGPKPFPLIGNMFLVSLLPQSLHAMSQKYGPIVYLRLGSKPTIIISSSEVVREVFKNHDRLFSGRPSFYAAGKLSYGSKTVTLAPYGDYWREIRKLVILELLSSKKVQLFQKVRSEEVSSIVDFISHSSGPIDMNELTTLLANSVASRVVFGKRYENSGIHQLLEDNQKVVGEFNIADFFPRMSWLNKINGTDKRIENVYKELDALFDKVIEEHQVDDPNHIYDKDYHGDLAEVLLRLKNDPNQAITITMDHVKGLLMEMFVAGTDGSSSTILWAMTELIRNPSMMKRAQEEVREVVKAKGKVEESDLSQLIYLKAVIKETFRLLPPIPLLFPKETLDDCTIFGYDISAKTRVIINAKTLMIDPNNWENANEFRPERFLDSHIDYKGQHFEFIPFGAGRRGCPGLNFGVALIELGLASLLYGFDWKLPNGLNIEDVDMEETMGLAARKKTPLRLVATPRKCA